MEKVGSIFWNWWEKEYRSWKKFPVGEKVKKIPRVGKREKKSLSQKEKSYRFGTEVGHRKQKSWHFGIAEREREIEYRNCFMVMEDPAL